MLEGRILLGIEVSEILNKTEVRKYLSNDYLIMKLADSYAVCDKNGQIITSYLSLKKLKHFFRKLEG